MCVLLTAKPYFLPALLPTAVCNFPSSVPFKLLKKKEPILKAVMGSRFFFIIIIILLKWDHIYSLEFPVVLSMQNFC